jgi:hypothetical protein
MHRVDRVRIAIGMNTCLIGLVASYALPFVLISLFSPEIPSFNPDFLDVQGGMFNQMNELANFARMVKLLQIVCLMISVTGFVMAYSTWMLWLLRPEVDVTGVEKRVNLVDTATIADKSNGSV